jgi:flagellar biogenesis protein FliO
MDAFTILIYLILFGVIIWLIEKLQRERYRAVLIARVCESRMEIMAKLSSKKRTGG